MATIIIENPPLSKYSSARRDYFLYYSVILEDGEILENYDINSNSSWCEIENFNNYSVEIEIKGNLTQNERTATITIDIGTNLGYYNKEIKITQEKFSILPIYKDKIISITTDADFVNYKITDVNNNILFSGKSYVAPDTNIAQIKINDICANFLDSAFVEKKDTAYETNAVKDFYLFVNGELYYNCAFSNWWFPNEENNLILNNNIYLYVTSKPIKKIFDKRQYLVYSIQPLTTNSSTNYTIDVDLYLTDVDEFVSVFEPFNFQGKKGWVYFQKGDEDLKEYGDKVKILNDIYEYKDTCAKFCLYYSNAFGGWDSLLINGNNKRNDNIVSNTYTKEDNRKTKYLNEITTTWVLNTDWLTDDEASRMYHLLESTNVILHNLEDDTLTDVIIKNNSCEYKTFSNNGKKKFNYVIEVEETQRKIRK